MPETATRDKPEFYMIRIKERLGPRWSEWFEGLRMTTGECGETILSGSVADQAALHGWLARVRDLNLTLISVNRIEPPQHEEIP